MPKKHIELLWIREGKGTPLNSPELVARSMPQEAKADREAFWVLHLNTKHLLVEKELVALGILDSSLIHPREVFKKAILNSSQAIITVHNHPGGDPSPAQEDKETWQRLKQAGEIIGIEVLDNLIITPNGKFYSERQGVGNV